MNLFVILFYFLHVVHGFYLPGLAPTNYCPPESSSGKKCKTSIPVLVNKLTSPRTVIAHDYKKFDFCPVTNGEVPFENLGQVVFGERLTPSNYKFIPLKPQSCTKICTKKYTSETEPHYDFLRSAIILQYSHQWMADNLPVTACLTATDNKRHCTDVIPLGCFGETHDIADSICSALSKSKEDVYLFNHAKFTVFYHPVQDSWSDEGMVRVVSIRLEPHSIANSEDCYSSQPLLLPAKLSSDLLITYSYSVEFQQSNVKWASRWDYLLDAMPQSNVQWLSILNSAILLMFLTGLVATILIRTLRRDFARYNQLEVSSEVQEESGWKLVHGDVFRPPSWGLLMCVYLGSGAQIFFMVLITLFFACLGFLSPANRGALMSCALGMYACSGAIAGYVSSRMYKFICGLYWKTNALLTATLCPTVVFSIFFIVNIALWAVQSAIALPFVTILSLLALWFCLSVPLCLAGAFFGFRKPSIEIPVRTNQIPRQIPFYTAYGRPMFTFFLGGLLPFSCIFIQLFFIFNSIWGTHFFYMFGLLFLAFLMFVVTCSETAVLLCYFQLCSEDYRWWWRAFHCGAGTSFYMFLYSIHYFISRLEFTDTISGFVYFSYSLIIVWLMFLLTGTIGFFACFWFVRKIYAVVKAD